MITVLDASAAVRLALGQADHKLVAEVLKRADWVAAPSLYLYEASNAMWKYFQTGEISQDALKEKLVNCAGLVDEIVPSADLFVDCFELACRLGHPAYDMAYLATCLRKKAGLVTFDRRLLEIAKELNIECYS
jgi:predicted nucleic acid-binding protein